MHNDTLSIFQQTLQNSVADNVKRKITKQLYSQSFKETIALLFTNLILIAWWFQIADTADLILWFAVITTVSCCRMLLSALYEKFNDNKNQHLWLHAWALSLGVIGCIYSVAIVYFTPFSQAEYGVSVGLFVVALSAGVVMAYGANLYGALCFIGPLTVLPSYFLYTQGNLTGLLTLLFVIFYAVLSILLVINMSNSYKKLLRHSYQHQQEKNKRKLLEKQLQDTNRRDGLTGSFSRRYFDERLEAEIGRSHRNHQHLCILMIDIDYFKEYNQDYGHVAGDACLAIVAELIEALCFRDGDLVARYGGEEFAIILPNIDSDGAVSFANKLQQEIQSKRLPHRASKLCSVDYLTISIGVADLAPFVKVSPAEILKNAEQALFEAKRQGRNRVYFNDNNGLNFGAAH